MLIAWAGCSMRPGGSRFSESDLIGKWKLSALKVSYDLGETWNTIVSSDYEWIEFGSDEEFHMRDTDMECTRKGEWHLRNDSIFYLVPDLSAMGGKCNAEILQCDEGSLIIQETDKNGHIGKSYYARD